VAGRVRFIVSVRLKPGSEDDFVSAYQAMHERAMQGIPGHVSHQLCRSADDPLDWIITSEFESEETWRAWDESDEHRQITGPFRQFFERGSSTRYAVELESRHNGG
jgi:heme oxygenase (mycobilin-producing)